jgi:hypothetical protein
VEAAEGAALSEADLRATGASIARAQERSGAIAWPDGHVDAWDHVECAMALSACGLREPARRAYAWLRAAQRTDGSWPRSSLGGVVTDPAAESHHAAYVAVGAWHEYLVTGDERHALTMWPTVQRAVEWTLRLRTPRGEIAWERDANGTAGAYALLSGCSSIHKSRFAMDWYYPVLGGAVRGANAAARLRAGWDQFVVPGLGVRCVSDQPWVTGAETCELVLALDAGGMRAEAAAMLDTVAHLRHPDGSYWTGWQYANRAHFPAERSSWTAAAVVLAADALRGWSGGAGVFREAGGPDKG